MLRQPDLITELIAGRDDWRRTLEADYRATAIRLRTAYRELLPGLRAQAGTLTTALAEAETALTAGQVRGLASYQALVERIEAEMDGFARLTQAEAERLSDRAISQGADAALELAAGQVRDPLALTGAWLRPDPAALAQLADYVDGEAMRARVARFGASAADNFGDTLLALTAQGTGPREIARRLEQWFQLPYSWAENQVRTSQIWSYRTATHATYRANADVLDGWMWWAALDGRTCMSCVAQHGTRHGSDATLNDHHRGRCTPVPVVRGTTWASAVETGAAWFERQPVAVQRQMMGPGLFDAWQRGDVRLNELSKPYQDDVYGTMLRQASLRELGVRPARR